MAANSGGGVVDWNTMIKPLVTYSLGSLSKQETVTLVKAIVDSEKELLESATPEHGHSVFYDVVTVLAAHVITAAAEADLIPRSSYPLTCQAARIICESLLNRMSHILKSPHPVISVKIFISAIQEFCTGHVIFSEEETGNILSVLRTTELPPKILSTAPSSWDKEGTTAAVKEVRRNRLDPSVLLFDQISMPVISMPPDVPVSELLAQEVTRIFQTLRAGQKFVELILSFPGLKNFVPSKVVLTEEAIRKSCATVQVLKNPSADLTALTEELNLVFRFMAPALFAPLSTEDSFRLNQLALASLNVTFAVMNHFYGNVATPMVKSTSSSNLSENEYPVGVMIVAQSIWTQKQVVQIFKENTGIPQWSWLNCCLALSKTLFISLYSYMRNVSPAPEQGGSSLKPSDVRDGTMINMATVQQLWNELATSLVTHGVQLVQSFISLLSIGEPETSTAPKLKGHLSNFQNELRLSSTERIQGFFEGSVNVIELLVQIITLSYRRACRLKLATAAARNDNSGPSEGDNKALFSTEDDSNGNNLDMSLEPNTLEIDYTNDAEAEGDNNSVSDLMTTEDEDERDDENEGELDRSYDIGEYDDEPFLGKWLQSVLNPPETLVEDSEVRSDKKSTNEGAAADEVKSLTEKFIPEKDCAGALIKSALTALRFLTKDIVCSCNATVKSLSSSSFTEQTAALLALILIDLDQEKSSAEVGAISSLFDESLNRTFYDFSAEMGKLVQNLLAQKILSASVQQCLLDQLGVDLGPSGRWYLGLQPRALAVLVQVVLLKAQDKESLVVQILKRVLETICEDISTPGSPPAKYADLPVEHAQTLVFLFHTLSLMQKKAIMIDTARAVITVSNRLNGRIQDRHQLSSLSRLLLIFDYFIRQLYEPSLSLISQVQYNLFNDETSAGSASGQGQSWGNNKSSGKSALKKKSSSSLSSDNVPVTEQGSTSGTTTTTTTAGATTATAAAGENQNGIGSGGVVSWNEKALPPARLYYDSPIVGSDEGEKGDIRPKFYNLIRVEPNYQENPRLDGLAMNFLMNKNDVNFKDKMAYSEVIEAILRLVELRMVDTENKATQQYIQYFLSRLLFGLPPPHEFLLKLEESAGNCDWLSDKPALVLYLMIWLPRLQNRIYSSWIRDIFSKQGLTTTQSEDLAKRTGVSTFSSSFVVPFLQAASRWIPRASSQIPVYFFAVEAALVFAHENMEEYLTPESSPGSDANKKEEEITSIFRNILHATLDAIRTDVCCTDFSSKHKSKNFSLATCIKSTSHLLAIGSGFLAQNSMAKVVNKYMDPDLAASFQKFLPSDFAFDDQYPEFNVKKFSADIIPGESYLLTIVNGHAGGKISQMNALKHLLCSVVKLCGAGINGKNGKKVAAAAAPEGRRKELQELLYPLLLDRVAEFMAPLVGQCIDPIWTKSDTPMGKNLTEIFVSVTLRAIVDPELRAVIPSESQAAFMEESVNCLMTVLENNVAESVEIVLDKTRNGQMLADLFNLIHSLEFEGVVEKLCNYLSMILDTSPVEQEEICKFFKKNLDESPSVSSAEKSVGNVTEKPGSVLSIEKLPAKLFRLDLFKSEKSVEASCKFLGGLAVILRLGDKSTRKVIVTLLTSTLEVLNENLKTLKSPEDLTGSFPHVLRLLIKLAGQAEGPEGHTPLFRQMTSWFFTLCENLDEELCEAVGEDSAKPPWLQSITIMTDYMLDVGKALQAIQNNLLVGASSSSSRAPEREGTPGSVSPPNETEDNFDLCDSEGGEEAGGDDEDSGGEDSDDEGLNSRLCTYTITQKEFMSQHWYHCHTCDMTDGVGVCSVCARVCHKGHDVTYAKFGSFFCDCGAKTDGSCGALVRRLNNPAGNEATPAVPPAAAAAAAVPEVTNGNSYNPFVSATEAVDNRRASSPTNLDAKSALTTATILFRNHSAREWSNDVVTSRDLAKREGQLKGFNFEEIMEALKEFSVKLPRRTIDKLVPVVHQLADSKTPVGAYLRVRSALDKLRNGEEQLVFSSSEDLVIPTLGSQEGAFENIKMQYNGDQGSTIRQLINTQVVRRSTVAALSAPAARRNYLAVSQEKGKLTILQLGALLSGAEVGKKKLTLPRLATVTLPFTALTMATNPLRDDVIAVCGLKDCHVLVIGTGGTITSHFVLQPQLESQNHIIKPVWIPGSQTELAILTSDAVKIYDLARDTISPIFYFLLPTGKVRDATFVVQDKYRYIVIMSFEGRIFYEKLSDVTSASHGYYYVTNDLNFQDTEMLVNENNSASLDSKGVSLYYSHALKLLFYTYPNGKSYVGTLDDLEEMNNPLSKGVLITPKAAGKPASLGLAQWTEVLGHPGLIFAMGYNSVPYVLLMTEKGSYIQEIRMVGKIKPVDIVAIRHMANHGKMKTSLLILCDDGSLRVCDASESTEFWLNPKLRPHQDLLQVKPFMKKGISSKRLKQVPKCTNGKLIFPVDFFEHCQPIQDVEFGGNDLLQTYNAGQIRNRLNSPGMYIVATKSSGFNLEISCNDGSMVITGIRVLLGSQDVNRAPSYIQVFGRSVPIAMTRTRWYDVPFTREESIQAESKISVTFGPSSDPQCATFVDSVKVYGKTKDSFGWPEDSDDIVAAQAAASAAIPVDSSVSSGGQSSARPLPGTAQNYSIDSILVKRKDDELVERVVTNVLEMCEIAVTVFSKDLSEPEVLSSAVSTVTSIYLENYPPVSATCRSFLSTVMGNKTVYYEHKDKALFSHCISKIVEMTSTMKANSDRVTDVDPESFRHIVTCVKNIAVVRPQHIIQFDYAAFNKEQDLSINLTEFVADLVKIFGAFVNQRPDNPHIVAVDRPGIQRVEAVAMCLADIIYSLMISDISLVDQLSSPLFDLLLSPHKDLSVPVRQLFTKRLRPKNMRKRRVTVPGGPSPPHCTSPDTAAESPREVSTPSGGSSGRNIVDPANIPLVEVDEPIVMLGQDNDAQMPILNPLDAFMGADGFIAPGIDLQSDAEDEAMVELAIALSLQEQVGGAALAIQGIQEGLQALEDMHQEVLHVAEAMSPPEDEPEHLDGAVEGGAESDATASPPPSDDEGSTVATEGSTMRNSEPGGSESSGSSGGGGSVRGRSHSSGGGGQGQSGNPSASSDVTRREGRRGDASKSKGSDKENVAKNPSFLFANAKPFRLGLMKVISDKIVYCSDPLTVIPLLQVLLVIITELDGSSVEERSAVENMVNQLLKVIKLEEKIKLDKEWERDVNSEITLISLRMLSILVSRWRQPDIRPENNWISRITAEIVYRNGLVQRCKDLLHVLRSTWKGSQEVEDAGSSSAITAVAAPAAVIAPLNSAGAGAEITVNLLKPSVSSNPPDYGPFFLKQYVKSHCHDILEELPLLLSEMALRFPYQVKKIINQEAVFDSDWEELLCEMLQNRNAPFVRRQARKLLLNIAGTRENYHLLRDLHNIKFNLNEFKRLIGFEGNSDAERFAKASKMEFKYSQLVSMVEHLNTCIDIATQRPASWQTYCKNEDALEFIIQMSGTADESLTTAILTLLKIAIDGVPFESKNESVMLGMSEDEKALKSLAHQIIDNVEKRAFLEFVKKYLLEHPVLTTRWQAHALLLGFFLTSDCAHQLKLVNALWELWPFVPAAGVRAAQFVDILGYATLNNDHLKSTDLRQQVSHCISSIESQGNSLLAHPNANIYSSLVPFVSVEGFYLESEPCEVCYNIDKPYTTQKLATIKADAKFTGFSQIFKLASTLSVIRLSIRLTEVKKARMIKNMVVYYSAKNLPIVELKNKPNLWQMARRVVLSPSQTEIKLDFSVPITAANIMLEFLEFYENVQATSETLQCPRCSASVPAQPGVCSNCGENVFQCHKCRAINYDERDPFLCHSCGFCKYAKMDITVLAKNVVAVDPIENEEDHKKAETAVSSLLEKADQTYKQQQQMKGCLETMMQSIKERRSMAGVSTGTTTLSSVSSSGNAVGINLGSVQAPQSYAAVAAVANALNNNVQVPTGGSNGGAIAGVSGTQVLNAGSGVGASSSLVLKNVQSLAYCYAIDCKNSYEELNRLMRKVWAYRKEMLKLDPTSYSFDTMDNITYRRCYGCMASSITLSLKLLQALITAGSPRDPFDPYFLSFLLRLSQSAGSTALKEQVKNALCFFVKDDSLATIQLTNMITSRVMAALNKETWSDVSFETSEEISLLASLLQMYDSCWEIKLRSLMGIFTHAINRLRDPRVTETGLLPCLKIIQNFIRATSADKEKVTVAPVEAVTVNLEAWMKGDENYSFEMWKKRLPKVKKNGGSDGKLAPASEAPPGPTSSVVKERKKGEGRSKRVATAQGEAFIQALLSSAEGKITNKKEGGVGGTPAVDVHENYLMKTYGRVWLDKFFKLDTTGPLQFDSEFIWIKKLIFCPGSVQTRAVTATLLKDLAQIPQRRLKIMELLTSFMEDLPTNGESCREFMELYRDLATPAEFSAFLNAKGALNIVCKLLDEHIEKLHYLEAVTMHSDLSQGIAVWELSRLLSALAIPSVRRNRRVSLLSTVLGGYLALKRLRLHRTRPIEEAQDILLQLLEEITSGTEEETKIFMSVCVETLKKCPKDDLTTPVFVFERLCSLIVHEENEVAEFFVSLDKDPQQEDFLQGRMLGNPYSSNETGIGPLMRDIKNKICTDCELVALLEDDNGMELLVNNKIISLDLPVKEVYKRIWLPTNGQIEPMRIVYRMRGLLGDATEEFVESFASPTEGPEDNEATYKLANVLVDCGGLRVVLNSLENLLNQQFVMPRAKPLIAVILKLLSYSAKIKRGREALLNPDLNAVQILLPILRLCLQFELTCIQGSSGVVHLTDQVLEILEIVLTDACALDEVAFRRFAKSRGSLNDVRNLLQLTQKLKNKPTTMITYLKVLACLTYTEKDKMMEIFEYYSDCWSFFNFDNDPNPDFATKLEQMCTLVSNIQAGPFGATLKDLAIERQAVELCLEYIRLLAPSLKPPMGRPDSDEWKEMVSKPSLKYVLRLLAGFAANHAPTQEALKDSIYVIHQLEQVSSDEHVGSLAENALEALRTHEKIWKEVEGARRATREEKKRMAMAMRQRQLSTMGMKTNDKGQVTAAVSTMLDQMEELAEETGLICVICREGYKYQPTKVLGIYTFSKRCLLEEHELKSRKTYGYCTVSHFNVVHVDCHMAAIRLARSRDEWESASLQNTNTRCNGLIPLWGQQVPESAFAACLARHNAYLQEATGSRDVGFSSGVHDIKLLLLRFAEEKTFHEDTGGGGPESNMHLIPYLIHTALYVLNTTRGAVKESRNVEIFLFLFTHLWKEDAYAVEGVCYHMVVSLLVNHPDKWMQNRVQWLKRILGMCAVRCKKNRAASFEHFRSGLIFLCLIHGLYTVVFKDIGGTGEWPSMLADFIRKNDEPLMKTTSTLLSLYQQKLLTAKSYKDFLDILGISEDPVLRELDDFMTKLWDEMNMP